MDRSIVDNFFELGIDSSSPSFVEQLHNIHIRNIFTSLRSKVMSILPKKTGKYFFLEALTFLKSAILFFPEDFC